MSKRTEENRIQHFVKSFGMIILGVVLDVADLATFGAWGLYLGAMVGGLLGLYLAIAMRWGWVGQCLMALFGGAYCMLPATELIPVASFVFACVQFISKSKSNDKDPQ